jgi:hypothetical protein
VAHRLDPRTALGKSNRREATTAHPRKDSPSISEKCGVNLVKMVEAAGIASRRTLLVRSRTRVRTVSNERVYVCRPRIISERAAWESGLRESSSS